MPRIVPLLLLCAFGCDSTTEIFVSVRSNLEVPATLNRIELSVFGAGRTPIASKSFPLDGPSDLPLTLSIVQKVETRVVIEARGFGSGGDEALSFDMADVAFQSGNRFTVDLFLRQDCSSTPCPASMQCLNGRCEMPTDGGADASIDASTDAITDAQTDAGTPRCEDLNMVFSGPAETIVTAMDSDLDGNLYVTGRFRGTVQFGPAHMLTSERSDVFFLKIDPSGSVEWAHAAPGTTAENFANVLRVTANGVVAAGQGVVIEFGRPVWWSMALDGSELTTHTSERAFDSPAYFNDLVEFDRQLVLAEVVDGRARRVDILPATNAQSEGNLLPFRNPVVAASVSATLFGGTNQSSNTPIFFRNQRAASPPSERLDIELGSTMFDAVLEPETAHFVGFLDQLPRRLLYVAVPLGEGEPQSVILEHGTTGDFISTGFSLELDPAGGFWVGGEIRGDAVGGTSTELSPAVFHHRDGETAPIVWEVTNSPMPNRRPSRVSAIKAVGECIFAAGWFVGDASGIGTGADEGGDGFVLGVSQSAF